MDKRKVLSKLLPMIVLVSLSIAAGVTGAAVIHSMQLENPIKTPVVEGGITENLSLIHILLIVYVKYRQFSSLQGSIRGKITKGKVVNFRSALELMRMISMIQL